MGVCLRATQGGSRGEVLSMWHQSAGQGQVLQRVRSAATPGAAHSSDTVGPVNPASEWDRRRGGERKLVTVLFADIPGFTSLAERMDPERLRDLMNECFDHLVPCVEECGGTVDKFMGDAVMALFGAPVSHDNDAERAVRAALDMRRALPAFASGAGVDLSLHIGINTGLVLAGSVGGGNRLDYSVMGDAVNVAARLEEAGWARGDPHRARHAPTGRARLPVRNRGRDPGAGPQRAPRRLAGGC